MATTDQWRTIEGWAEHLTGVRRRASSTAACLLDLRRRVEALEQRALTAPEPSAVEPAPAADRPLWEVMREAYVLSAGARQESGYAAEIVVIADWLAAREHCGAASALRIEARRAREGA